MFGLSKKEVDSPTPEVQEVTVQDQYRPLTYQDQKNLKNCKYEENKNLYPREYLIYNKKTNQLATIRAHSPYQACRFLKWKPNQVKLVENEVKES